MTITVVCRKSKIAWLFLPCVLLLASCGKRQVTKSATVEAQQTAGKIRQGWATACRPLTITSEGMETGLPDIGVYMHLADATDTERNAFYGVPFIYDNGRYVAQKHHTVTALTRLPPSMPVSLIGKDLPQMIVLYWLLLSGKTCTLWKRPGISARRFPWKWIGAVQWCYSASDARVTGCKSGWMNLRLRGRTFADRLSISLTWVNGDLWAKEAR